MCGMGVKVDSRPELKHFLHPRVPTCSVAKHCRLLGGNSCPQTSNVHGVPTELYIFEDPAVTHEDPHVRSLIDVFWRRLKDGFVLDCGSPNV